MKKLLLVVAVVVFTMMNCHQAEAKEYKKGKFIYEYKNTYEGAWITKITPISSKGIGTLDIPSHLGGQEVVKLGVELGSGFEGSSPNLFGVEMPMDDLYKYQPEDIYRRVFHIKTIKIPSTVHWMTPSCFYGISNGKNINIPKRVTENVRLFASRNDWNKFTISSENKKFKVVKGCLLSRDGMKLYNLVRKIKTVDVPKEVREIPPNVDFRDANTIIIHRGVTKITKMSTKKAITVKISKANKRYTVKDGSVYSKVTGRLVAGYVKNRTLIVPDKVKSIGEHGYFGGRPNKIIIPASVTAINIMRYMVKDDTLTFICKGKTPPKLEGQFAAIDVLNLYVPKNCKSAYLKKWKFVATVKVTIYEQ